MKRKILMTALLAILLMLISTSAMAACGGGITWTSDGETYTCTGSDCFFRYDWNFISDGNRNGDYCIGGNVHVGVSERGGRDYYYEVTYKTTEHTWKHNYTNPATCTKRGTWTFYCSLCGWGGTHWTTDGVDPNNHPAEALTKTEVAATCCEAGSYEYYCTDCGATVSGDAIPPLGHNAEGATYDKLVEPTCTTEGSYGVYCSNTNKELSYRVLAKDSSKHTYPTLPNKSASPTCQHGYLNTFICTSCGHEMEVDMGGKKDHEVSSTPGTVVDATCDKDGSKVYYCKYGCGTKMQTETLPALGHEADASKEYGEPATCTSDGYSYNRCVRWDACKTEMNPKTLKATGHTVTAESRVELGKASTCYSFGYNNIYCDVCGKVAETESLPLADHVFSDWMTQIPATCTTEGVATRICVCEKWEEKVLPATDHNWVFYWEMKSTCSDQGFEYVECDNEGCSAEKISQYYPLREHNWTAWSQVKAPTVTEEGQESRTCQYSDCGEVETRSIPKLTPAPKPTDDITPAPKPTDDITPAPKPTDDITPAPKPTDDITPAPKPTDDITPAPKPTDDITPAPKPTDDITPAPKPTDDITPAPKPTDDITPAPKPTDDITPAPKPTDDIDPTPGSDDDEDCQHVEEEMKGFPPTCTEQGREDGTICGECGDVLDGGEWIAPTGHKPVVIPAVPATETEKGLTEGLKCETCGKVLKEQYPVDFEGNLYDPDDPDGPSIGTEIPKNPGDIVDPNGEVIGKLEDDVITDPKGEYVGSVDEDGNIVDENGNVIGKVDENGKVTDKDGNHVGDVFGYDELDGRLEPGHPNFNLKDYLDEYYTHVEDGDKIRPTIDEDKCIIGTKEKLEGDGITVLIKGAEDYAICPIDKYPLSQWIDLGNGQHKRVCTCLDCDYYEIAACVPFEITVNEVEYKICPICGHFTDEQAYEWIKGVKVGGVGNMNELIARDVDKPFGTDAALVKDMSEEPAVIISSFTAVKSTKGVLLSWDKGETLDIPMAHPGDVDLVMMNYDGEFTSVSYAYDNGFVIINADEHGLYLFVE